MGISPPTQYAPTEVTESASRVAAPASAAFPPFSRILIPAAVAAGLPETTTPWLPTATLGPRRLVGVLVAWVQAQGATKRIKTHNVEMIWRIGVGSENGAKELDAFPRRCCDGHIENTSSRHILSQNELEIFPVIWVCSTYRLLQAGISAT